jgi:hypothetical protein
MSVEIGFYDKEEGEFEELEPLFNTPGLFAFAKALTFSMEHIRIRNEEPTCARGYDAFYKYLNERRDIGEGAFTKFCEGIARIQTEMYGEGEVEKAYDMATGGPVRQPRVEDYDPDVRAFLGRLILSGEIVDENTAELVFWALFWPASIIKVHRDNMEAEDHEALPAYNFAWESMHKIAEYAEAAYTGGRSFGFDA